MSTKEKINIEVHRSTWKELNAMKEPGEAFDDVLQRELVIE